MSAGMLNLKLSARLGEFPEPFIWPLPAAAGFWALEHGLSCSDRAGGRGISRNYLWQKKLKKVAPCWPMRYPSLACGVRRA